MKKNHRLIKIIPAVTALITVLGLTSCSCTSCSCGGLGSVSNLISGNGGSTTTTTASESTTAATGTTAASETTTAKESAATTTAATSATTATTAAATTAETTTAHVHDWQYNGEYPSATCTNEGKEWYICSVCGAEYYDIIPALDHNWERNGGSPPDCTHDGGKWYICTRCGEEYVEVLSAIGHDWTKVYHCPPSCVMTGYDTFQCTQCGAIENMNYDLYPPTPHNQNGCIPDYTSGNAHNGHIRCCDYCGYEFPETFEWHTGPIDVPTPGEESISHVLGCPDCGWLDMSYKYPHKGNPCEFCGYDGPKG